MAGKELKSSHAATQLGRLCLLVEAKANRSWPFATCTAISGDTLLTTAREATQSAKSGESKRVTQIVNPSCSRHFANCVASLAVVSRVSPVMACKLQTARSGWPLQPGQENGLAKPRGHIGGLISFPRRSSFPLSSLRRFPWAVSLSVFPFSVPDDFKPESVDVAAGGGGGGGC